MPIHTHSNVIVNDAARRAYARSLASVEQLLDANEHLSAVEEADLDGDVVLGSESLYVDLLGDNVVEGIETRSVSKTMIGKLLEAGVLKDDADEDLISDTLCDVIDEEIYPAMRAAIARHLKAALDEAGVLISTTDKGVDSRFEVGLKAPAATVVSLLREGLNKQIEDAQTKLRELERSAVAEHNREVARMARAVPAPVASPAPAASPAPVSSPAPAAPAPAARKPRKAKAAEAPAPVAATPAPVAAAPAPVAAPAPSDAASEREAQLAAALAALKGRKRR